MIRKYKSLPSNLNKIQIIYFENNKTQSFNNFNELELKGEQNILTFGKISSKNKTNRKKVIEYFYKNLYKAKL
tara:strand:+ start:304 stop:522 length:219 start_codon:yes stop_codon:yes gene_type:complete